MAWINWNGKKVFVIVDTTSGEKRYSGVIKDVQYLGKNSNSIDIYFLEMIDKFGDRVGFNSNSIKFIGEEE